MNIDDDLDSLSGSMSSFLSPLVICKAKYIEIAKNTLKEDTVCIIQCYLLDGDSVTESPEWSCSLAVPVKTDNAELFAIINDVLVVSAISTDNDNGNYIGILLLKASDADRISTMLNHQSNGLTLVNK